jgi:alkylation response protein AidB-like acyl-CoA dehydrogenase
MANLLVNERDVQFVLYEQLKVQDICQMAKFGEFSPDVFDMVLDAARKLAENELWPVNADGDKIGVQLKDGQVRVPESFHRIQRLYCEGGWPSLSIDQESGGQGIPAAVGCAATESMIAANMGFMGYSSLTIGAARVLEKFGNPEQQSMYMEKMVSGEWCGTMCLTEPQAGSDVGALRTKARLNPDGTYSIITGSKIFITGGDQDLTENIVHLVLARVEGAAAGTKGISIFIVPKKRIENDQLVDNDVTTVAVESKLGLHASATCALNFGERDNCIGHLIGPENSGMSIMFHMMNEARLLVGLQGLAQASAAYMYSVRYANERLQGPHFSAIRDPDASKVPIIEHPDVRRMLMWMKSTTEGMRSLLYYVAQCSDLAECATDQAEAAKYRGIVDLLIPICKAWSTDMGFRVTELAVQIHGGYGYCHEYPVEQFLRDVKITSIYEGTNGIQALDLVGRKLRMNQGALFQTFMGEVSELADRVNENPGLKAIAARVDDAKSHLIEATMYFAQKAMSGEPAIPVLYATPYLELFGDLTIGFMLLWQAEIADEKLQAMYANAGAGTPDKQKALAESDSEAAFYLGKIASAEFFSQSVLSLAQGKAKAIMQGGTGFMELPKEAFLRT